jgi:hypothetical protein
VDSLRFDLRIVDSLLFDPGLPKSMVALENGVAEPRRKVATCSDYVSWSQTKRLLPQLPMVLNKVIHSYSGGFAPTFSTYIGAR